MPYRLRGELNGRPGAYDIFARPSLSGRTEVVNHRFFNPNRWQVEITEVLEFPASYSVRALDELPSTGLIREFTRDGRVVDGGILVEILAERGAWAGVVANASKSVAEAHSGIYSTPSPSVVCVVARGDAYFIDVDAPERWWVLEDAPVVAVRSASAEDVLVLATPWRVVAVGRNEVVWRTARLAIDGIELGNPAAGEVRGIADPRDDAEEFVVDLRTGRHKGGFGFPE